MKVCCPVCGHETLYSGKVEYHPELPEGYEVSCDNCGFKFFSETARTRRECLFEKLSKNVEETNLILSLLEG